jgi:hypothetical protein
MFALSMTAGWLGLDEAQRRKPRSSVAERSLSTKCRQSPSDQRPGWPTGTSFDQRRAFRTPRRISIDLHRSSPTLPASVSLQPPSNPKASGGRQPPVFPAPKHIAHPSPQADGSPSRKNAAHHPQTPNDPRTTLAHPSPDPPPATTPTITPTPGLHPLRTQYRALSNTFRAPPSDRLPGWPTVKSFERRRVFRHATGVSPKKAPTPATPPPSVAERCRTTVRTLYHLNSFARWSGFNPRGLNVWRQWLQTVLWSSE